jgi:alkanesulfonate monooxygenase SsuD/methylene tetrahydromethanopterin reductase-like flavin-dependent oxidoreductase (luciferase family)
MRLSCALVTNVESPEVIVEAERLGYRRAWLYDSPALTSDVWVALALAAERTSTIGLGPGVLVPNVPQLTFSGTPAQLRDRIAEYDAIGVTELVYQPAGPDVVGELTRMMTAVGGVTETASAPKG